MSSTRKSGRMLTIWVFLIDNTIDDETTYFYDVAKDTDEWNSVQEVMYSKV